MMLEFRLAYDTDMQQGEEDHEEDRRGARRRPGLAPRDMLQPLKSQGVIATDDSAIVVRAKYMAQPGDGAFMIRRVAYDKILKALPRTGIEFASRRVAVYMPPGEERNAKQIVAAALPAIEAQELEDKGKAT